MSTVTLEVSPETISLIETEAKSAGISVEEYVRNLIPNVKKSAETISKEERRRRLIEWVEGHHSDAPALALEDISRETIY